MKDKYSELLIGCGAARKKLLHKVDKVGWHDLITLDIEASHNPDVVWDLNVMPYPFDDNTFDEIHAYEVLEHLGQQGDYRFFFAQFSEFWRILKPNGVFMATCPSRFSKWAFGDPSHTRVFQPEQLTFLQQKEYTNQIGKTSMTDFRSIYKADFSVELCQDDKEIFQFVLAALKDSA